MPSHGILQPASHRIRHILFGSSSYCLWLVFHCHNKCHHFRAVCTPTGFATFLTKINLIEREEAGQISFRRNIFFFDEMIFRQIDCFICNKVRCGGKCCHKSQHTVLNSDSLALFMAVVPILIAVSTSFS